MTIAQRPRADQLFPVLAYEYDHHLFLMADSSIGFGFLCRPMIGADASVSARVNVLLNQDWPPETLLQVSLWTSPDIEESLAVMQTRRLKQQKPTYKTMTQASIEFLRQGTTKPPEAISGARLRRSHILVTVKLPMAYPRPSEQDILRASELQMATQQSLSTIGLYPELLGADQYVRILNTILNWQPDAGWKDRVVPECDPTQLIRDQLLDYDNALELDEKGLWLGSKRVKTLSAKRTPDHFYFGSAKSYLGDILSGNVLHPEAIVSATLEDVEFDDHARVYYGGNLIYTGSTGWGGACELSNSWVDHPNRDVTYAFNSTGHKVFKQDTMVGGNGEGYSRIRLRYDLSKLITQDEWSWSGRNCQNLANAITDGICQAGSQLNCTNDPANASGCYVDPTSQVMVCGSDLAQAPVASSTGIRNTCMSIQAAGNCDLNQYGQCWTDTAGTHCLEPPANGTPTKSCSTLETQGCSFIKSQCTSVLASGTCWDSVDTYDCGQTVGIPGIQSNTQQQCAGPIRCMGEDCISVNRTQSQDFSKAVALLNSAQQMAMDLHCDYANTDLQQKDPTTCQVFQGKPASCKMVGGALSLVDCCETPSGAMGLGRYIDLLIATSQMDSAVMAMDSTSAIRGAWETMRTPFTLAGDAWNSFQADFASTVNDLVGTDMLSTSDIASQGLLDSLKGELMKSVAEWIGQTFGEAAGNALFSAGGQAAFDSAGNLTPAAQSGGVELGGGAAMAGQLLSTLMAAYTAVMIVIMIIQMVYSCEEPEYELAAKKQLKVCKDLGTYCESKVLGVCMVRKESYCCYNSPLAKILNEQIKPQLGMDFGTPESPTCTGIKVADLDRVDWTQVNLDEWLAILAQTGHLPTAANAASMLNLDQLTGTGSRLNPQKYGAASSGRQDTLTRTQGRMTDLDVPTVKRQSELEGWGMGPQ